MRYDGEERRKTEWHLEKSISVGHIITTLSVIISVLLWASHTETRLTVLEAKGKIRDERIVQLTSDIKGTLLRIETRLDTMSDNAASREAERDRK